MPSFEGSHSETFTVAASLDAAKAHFGDLATIVANSSDVESADIDGDTIHFVLKAQDHGVAKFQGRYSCRYAFDGDTLRWETVGEGNTDQSGEAVFSTVDGRTQVAYSEKLVIDLDVPKMMAPMLKPVVAKVLGHELKGYVKRMVAALG